MRREVVGALLRRHEVGVVKRRVEAGRLDARRTHRLLGIGKKLHVERTAALLVGGQIEAADAAAARQTTQRERAAAHGEAVLLSGVHVVDEQVRAGRIVEAVPGQDRRAAVDESGHGNILVELVAVGSLFRSE